MGGRPASPHLRWVIVGWAIGPTGRKLCSVMRGVGSLSSYNSVTVLVDHPWVIWRTTRHKFPALTKESIICTNNSVDIYTAMSRWQCRAWRHAHSYMTTLGRVRWWDVYRMTQAAHIFWFLSTLNESNYNMYTYHLLAAHCARQSQVGGVAR